jgi:hypothetical protein
MKKIMIVGGRKASGSLRAKSYPLHYRVHRNAFRAAPVNSDVRWISFVLLIPQRIVAYVYHAFGALTVTTSGNF